MASTSNSKIYSLGLTRSWKQSIANTSNSKVPCLATPPIFFVPFLFFKLPVVNLLQNGPTQSPSSPALCPGPWDVTFRFLSPRNRVWLGCDLLWPVGFVEEETGTSPKPSLQAALQLLLAFLECLPSPWKKSKLVPLADKRPHGVNTSQSGCPKHIREPSLDEKSPNWLTNSKQNFQSKGKDLLVSAIEVLWFSL